MAKRNLDHDALLKQSVIDKFCNKDAEDFG